MIYAVGGPPHKMLTFIVVSFYSCTFFSYLIERLEPHMNAFLIINIGAVLNFYLCFCSVKTNSSEDVIIKTKT